MLQMHGQCYHVIRMHLQRPERLKFLRIMCSTSYYKERVNFENSLYTGCPRVAKKLHNLFAIKDSNFFFFLDDSYAATAYSENIAVYIQVSQYYKNTKVMFF
jgi:hypothetical protein